MRLGGGVAGTPSALHLRPVPRPESPLTFTFRPLELPGLVLVEPTVHGDERGFFLESYRRSAFREAGIDHEFVQDNRARSRRGVLRGLHYQAPPAPQGKLVQVVRGRILDVAVDIRRGSPAFAAWHAVELDGEAKRAFWIPPGFAHGYLTLTEEAEVAYKVTAEYDPDLDRGIRWDDPRIGVEWPIATPVLSGKDRSLPGLDQVESPFAFEGPAGR